MRTGFSIIRCSLVLCLLILVGSSCSSKERMFIEASGYEDSYVPEEDYNLTGLSCDLTYDVIEKTGKGLLFLAGNYLFFADSETMSAHPVCYKSECMHNQEEDPEKVPKCDAFFPQGHRERFLGSYRDRIYLYTTDLKTDQIVLLEMNEDGSGRRVLLSDMSDVLQGTTRMHRGVIFFADSETDLDGNRRYALKALSLVSKQKKPTVLFEGTKKNGTIIAVIPYGNYVYYTEQYEAENAGDEKQELSGLTERIYRCDIRSGKTETVTSESFYSIVGVRNGKIILNNKLDYFQYDPGSGELVPEHGGLQRFSEEHPDWTCMAGNITDRVCFFSCFDRVKMESIPDRIVTGVDGNEVCRLEDHAFCIWGSQIIRLNSEDYYISWTPSFAPFAVQAYKMSDLEAGKVQEVNLLEVEDYNKELSPGYIYHAR